MSPDLLDRRYYDEIKVRQIKIADISTIVCLHKSIHYNWFITQIGDSFLDIFYRQFTSKHSNFGFIAHIDSKPVGFIVGTTDLNQVYTNLYRDNLLGISYMLILSLAKNHFVRQEVLKRLKHLFFVCKAFLFYNQGAFLSKNLNITTSVCGSLVSIGVLATFRNKAIGKALLFSFCEEIKKEGVGRVCLKTTPDNLPAIAFYEKNGWHRDWTTDSEVCMSIQLQSATNGLA